MERSQCKCKVCEAPAEQVQKLHEIISHITNKDLQKAISFLHDYQKMFIEIHEQRGGTLPDQKNLH